MTHTDAEIAAALSSIKTRFAAGELSVAEAGAEDRYWRAQSCVNRGYIKPGIALTVAPPVALHWQEQREGET